MAAVKAPIRRLAATIALAAAALSGCGSEDDAGSSEAKTVEITATEYAFAGDPSTTIVAGDTIRFRMTNAGELRHEMQVLDGSGRLIDRTPEVDPGGVGEVVVTFDEPGVYQVICDVDDHLSRGQQASFTVADA